jgi:hypothetical protein
MSKELLKQVIHSIINEDDAVSQTKLHDYLVAKMKMLSEEGGQSSSLEELATISDKALDDAYHYGRSSPGNTFGWQANLKSAEFAKKAVDSGKTDIEQIADAIHKGWNVTAKAFVQNPDQFDDRKNEILKRQKKEPNKSPEEIAQEVDALIEKKRAQRETLMNIEYADLPDDEKEKDRVVAKAILNRLKGDSK